MKCLCEAYNDAKSESGAGAPDQTALAAPSVEVVMPPVTPSLSVPRKGVIITAKATVTVPVAVAVAVVMIVVPAAATVGKLRDLDGLLAAGSIRQDSGPNERICAGRVGQQPKSGGCQNHDHGTLQHALALLDLPSHDCSFLAL